MYIKIFELYKMKNFSRFTFLGLLFVVILSNCNHNMDTENKMNIAENLMETNPDSALKILSTFDKHSLINNRSKARYALLMSMALDKNFIDTTNFNVLQPAIDYYFENGTSNEKLRTSYYQGRIYQNKFEFDNAMACFLKAEDFKHNCTDTLTYARLLVAQGKLYLKSFQIPNYINNNLIASKLYETKADNTRRLSCLIRALNGSIIFNDRIRSDSILLVADSISRTLKEPNELLISTKIAYNIRFVADTIIKNLLDSDLDLELLSNDTKFNITLGFLRLNNHKQAKHIFESIDSNSSIANSMRYLSIKPEVLEANKQYPEAIAAYKKYHEACEEENNNIYLQKTTVAQEQHEMELKHLYSIQRKDRMLLTGLVILFALVVIIGITYYQLHLGKTKQIIAEKEKSRLQLENDNLQKQNAVLELQKHNAELECERQNLAAENMQMKISQLESEKENLRTLMKENELSDPVRSSIQERIEMLNGLLAAHISDNTNYSKPYDKWIEMITQDRKRFMDSTRLAFKASHPAFMKYLEDRGLDESELNYVCLYAIGLRGKEIGEYIRLKRHYHMSSDIRKKLNLHEDDTNLGIYIRNLMKTT